MAEALGGLPLVLELTRNFLNIRSDLSIEALLNLLKAEGEMETLQKFAEKYGDELPSGHERSVAATFQMSYKALSPQARDVLVRLSFLAPVPVPRRLLKMASHDVPREDPAHPVDEALAELAVRYSLVELDLDQDPSVHRLISAYVRFTEGESSLPQKEMREAIKKEMERVADESDAKVFKDLKKVVPHAEHLLEGGWEDPQESIDLLGWIGWHYKNQGWFRMGENFWRRAMDMAEKVLKPDHPEVAKRKSNLAMVLQDLGELKEAKILLQEALESDENSYEPGHPRIALTKSNLAIVLRDLGEREEAKRLLQEALEANEKSFEPGHPTIALNKSNLAIVFKDLGELEEAKRLLQKALEAYEKSCEPGHPRIATIKSNLALVLQDLRKMKEAKRLLQEALESDEKSFEPGHPNIAISKFNLAMVLRDLGELDEAKKLLMEAHAALLERLGEDHPLTKMVKNNLEVVKKI